jgi:hypothetical protein
MGWALGLVQGGFRTVQPVASTIPNTLSQLPYNIGTNTKCTAIQIFSKFLIFGYEIKNDIPQHKPFPKKHSCHNHPAWSCMQEQPEMSDAGLLEAMIHDHLLPAPVVPLSEETWHAVLQGLRYRTA